LVERQGDWQELKRWRETSAPWFSKNLPGLWFVNSSAGHAVFASLPIIMRVMAISGEVKGDTTAAVRDMLRFALGVALIFLVGLVMSLALLDSFHLVPKVL
jgi:hypothetical protein